MIAPIALLFGILSTRGADGSSPDWKSANFTHSCPFVSESDLFRLGVVHQLCPWTYDARCHFEPLFDGPSSLVARRFHSYRCSENEFFNFHEVSIWNATRLTSALAFRDPLGRPWCLLTIFYAPGCRFSAKLAKAVNALPALFYPLKVVAVDATQDLSSRFNNRYGIVGTPTTLLWVNGVAVARLATDVAGRPPHALHTIVEFLELSTRLMHIRSIDAIEEGGGASGPFVVNETDDDEKTLLILSILTLVVAFFYYHADKPAIRLTLMRCNTFWDGVQSAVWRQLEGCWTNRNRSSRNVVEPVEEEPNRNLDGGDDVVPVENLREEMPEEPRGSDASSPDQDAGSEGQPEQQDSVNPQRQEAQEGQR